MSGHAFALGAAGLALVVIGPADDSRDLPPGDSAPHAAPEATPRLVPRTLRLRLAAGALGLATALVVGGTAGTVGGLLIALATYGAVGRLEPAEIRRFREVRSSELPLVLDLLAVCLRAGMPLVSALETVGEALPGSFSRDLATVSGLQRLGSAPAAAWFEISDDPDLAPVARAVVRSAESGSRLAAAFERLAVERRSALAAAGEARARRAGVLAMAPLGLCFLPAFVCVGIVPIILSLARQVLT
jgi:pilus assembly protein TadC